MSRIIQFLLEMICIAVLAFIMAGLFVDALEQDYQNKENAKDARMHQMIERGF